MSNIWAYFKNSCESTVREILILSVFRKLDSSSCNPHADPPERNKGTRLRQINCRASVPNASFLSILSIAPA